MTSSSAAESRKLVLEMAENRVGLETVTDDRHTPEAFHYDASQRHHVLKPEACAPSCDVVGKFQSGDGRLVGEGKDDWDTGPEFGAPSKRVVQRERSYGDDDPNWCISVFHPQMRSQALLIFRAREAAELDTLDVGADRRSGTGVHLGLQSRIDGPIEWTPYVGLFQDQNGSWQRLRSQRGPRRQTGAKPSNCKLQ